MQLPLKLAVALFTLGLLVHTVQAEDLSVHCGKADGNSAQFTTITAAVAKLAAKAAQEALGPNTITVTGNCVENVSIINLDNLTLQAAHQGASITDASNGTADTLLVDGSNRFVLKGFTINGSVDCVDNSVCRLYYNTIQNSQIGWGLRGSRCHIDSQGDSISNNPGGPGVALVNDSRVLMADDTISNNGGAGIVVNHGSFLLLSMINSTNTISNNGGHGIEAFAHGTVHLSFANITGNGGDGIRAQDGSVLRAESEPTVNQITGNQGAGVNLGDLSHAHFPTDGSISITGNLGTKDVYCAGQFAATRNVASVGGSTNCKETKPE